MEPPGGESRTQAAGESGQGLEQTQSDDQSMPAEASQSGARSCREWGARGSSSRLDQRHADRGHKDRHGEQQWTPEQAKPRKERQPQDDQVPFGHQEKGKPRTGRGRIQRLKRSAPPGSVINARPNDQSPLDGLAVNSSAPGEVT